MLKIAIAEILGTFIIVFIGTGAMVADDVTAGAVTHLGVCLLWGLAVVLAIVIAERIAQGHFNPAVSVAAAIKERMPLRLLALRIVSQCFGAIVASLLLHFIVPS